MQYAQYYKRAAITWLCEQYVTGFTVMQEKRIRESIADIVAVTGSGLSIGFEIKSPRDSPARISHQLGELRMMHKSYLVCDSKYIHKYQACLSHGAGLLAVYEDGGVAQLVSPYSHHMPMELAAGAFLHCEHISIAKMVLEGRIIGCDKDMAAKIVGMADFNAFVHFQALLYTMEPDTIRSLYAEALMSRIQSTQKLNWWKKRHTRPKHETTIDHSTK